MKTELKIDKGIATLLRNDKGLVCPFRAPFPVPSQAVRNAVEYHNSQCNSLCPHFYHDVNGTKGSVMLSCGTGNVNIPVDVIGESEKPKSNLVIIP